MQSAGRGFMPGILAGLMGGAGVTYAPKFIRSESSELSQLTAALASLRQSPSGSVTVVTGSGGNRALSTAAVVLGLSGAGYIALRLAGISLSSLVWVTRHQFRKGISALKKASMGCPSESVRFVSGSCPRSIKFLESRIS